MLLLLIKTCCMQGSSKIKLHNGDFEQQPFYYLAGVLTNLQPVKQ